MFGSCVSRSDKYNKNLKKYYVIFEEHDEDLSEDEEQQTQRDHEARAASSSSRCSPFRLLPQVADLNVEFKRLGRESLQEESDDGNDSEKERNAKQANTGAQAGGSHKHI